MKLFLCFFLFLFPFASYADTITSNSHYAISTETYEDTEMIQFDGEMYPNSIYELISIMDFYDNYHLAINSNGGSLREGFILNTFIENNSISVYIPEHAMCISACAFGIMTSNDIVNRGDGIYFHAPYLLEVDAQNTLLENFSVVNGVSMDMVELFIRSGYNKSLLDMIYRYTDLGVFIVFEDSETLYKFRTDHFDDQLDVQQNWVRMVDLNEENER